MDFKAKSRCYFMDVGLTTYFLAKVGCSQEDINGAVSENFVYLDLKRRIAHPGEIALETPAFATLDEGEIDFYVQTLKSRKTFAIEVKSGKNSNKTITKVREKKITDYILFAKGSTTGGIAGNIYTIPIYCIGRFKFDL